MLREGDQVPNFEVEASDGSMMRLEELKGKPFVIFFYPKAFTSGCTIETRRFGQLYPKFKELGVEVVGASNDTAEKQCAFAEATEASFPFVGDTSGKLGETFGVARFLLPVYKRATFVVDERGRVEKVISGEFKAAGHAEEAFEHVKQRKPVSL